MKSLGQCAIEVMLLRARVMSPPSSTSVSEQCGWRDSGLDSDTVVESSHTHWSTAGTLHALSRRGFWPPLTLLVCIILWYIRWQHFKQLRPANSEWSPLNSGWLDGRAWSILALYSECLVPCGQSSCKRLRQMKWTPGRVHLRVQSVGHLHFGWLDVVTAVWFMVVVQSLGCVWLFATPWAAALPASLSFTISWFIP